MKTIIAALLFTVICSTRTTSAQTARDNLKQQLRTYTDAFLQRDFESLVSMMPQKMVEIFGGREKVIEFHRQMTELQEQKDFTLKMINLSDPTEIISENSESFAIIPTILHLSNKNQQALVNDYLVAVSTDGGAHWAFVAGSDSVAGILRSYPKVSYALTIPQRTLVMNSDSKAEFRLEFIHQGGKWIPTKETIHKFQGLLKNVQTAPNPESPNNLYFNTEHHFSINFPEGWDIKQSTVKSTIIKATFHDGSGNFAYIAIAAYPWSTSEKLSADDMFIDLKSQYRYIEFERIDSGETFIQGKSAVFNTIAIRTPPKTANISKHYHVTRGDKLFRITAATNHSQAFFNQQLRVMEQSVLTFNFKH